MLIVSTMIAREVNTYPDSGKVWARDFPPGGEPSHPGSALDVLARPDPDLDYMDGEA